MFTAAARRQHRILDFDIENRPLSYWFGDVTTAEVTAIAWSWADEEDVEWAVLEPPPEHNSSRTNMLARFLDAYQAADMVTGHYIRRHDLPILQGALLEEGSLPLLESKLTQDTKLDLVKRSGLPASQEELSLMLGVSAPKISMSQADWREANRLTNDGRARTVQRVVGDVIQHKTLRLALLAEGLLNPPKLWTP